jgi:hypothetical protein
VSGNTTLYIQKKILTKTMTKEEAAVKILKVLNSRMAVMSKPMRDEALTLAEEYGINTKDLIEEWTKIAERI